MVRTKEEYLALLNETVKYYTDGNPRGKVDDMCSYLTDNGAMCAVGRCLQNPGDLCSDDNSAAVGDLQLGFGQEFDGMFKNEYQEFHVNFWECLQGVHDVDQYWTNDQELTTSGRERVDSIANRIKRGGFEYEEGI